MKKMHLLCNAHLDPVWLWCRDEGIAEVLSTFRVAAQFCEEYNSFVFNHNEAILYKWVEEHDPELFARIQKLVKEKKWVIMGGWYIQPDCLMPSGESILSQIELGREYFKEKFGVTPSTAINFDPFGHSRGLVQILKKSGYDNYLYMRPYECPRDNFMWEGYDGSTVLTHGMYKDYSTLKGKAIEKVKEYLKDYDDIDTGLCLWGIGNHGGGPSRGDIEALDDFKKISDTEIIHSSVDDYMKEIDTAALPTVNTSLIPCNTGCYTSMVLIKQANRKLENKIAVTKKAMTYAGAYNSEELKKAVEALAFCQFHDILPGTAIRRAEAESLATLSYGREIADKLFTKAFFSLCDGQKEAKDGEIPILIFNPHPYEIEGEFEAFFNLEEQNRVPDEITNVYVYDENGNFLPTQNEKHDCTINIDWMKKISFRGKLRPSAVTRFDCVLEVVKKEAAQREDTAEEFITVENERMKVKISRKTGLIDLYELDGKTLVSKSGSIEVYKDNEDPWGMLVDSYTDYEGSFSLMTDKAANEFCGYGNEDFSNVRVTENGPVRTKVQAFFEYNRSTAVVEYTIPKKGVYIDVNILLYSNEPNKMIKYHLDTGLCGTPVGSSMFGCEELFCDEKEAVFQKWCGIKDEEAALYVVNNGIYGGSFTKSSVKLSLLRTPIYSAHPIDGRPIAPNNRFTHHIDMGEREFFFRITGEENIEKEAQIFNEAPTALSFFPSGFGERRESFLQIDNPLVMLSSIEDKNGRMKLTLYNSQETSQKAVITFGNGKEFNLDFGKYELKFLEI